MRGQTRVSAIARKFVLQGSYTRCPLSSLSPPFFRVGNCNGLCFHPRPLCGFVSAEKRCLSHAFKDNQLGCDEQAEPPGVGAGEDDAVLSGNTGIFSACCVGLLTGISVVLFNNLVHEIRDLCWDEIPARGASWLRESPEEKMWERVILVPTCGGLVVSLLNMLQSSLDFSKEGSPATNLKAVLGPFLKATAAAVTLGTGNSLGPEGPSVEIGASVAKGVGTFFDRDARRKLSLKAAGSAAGLSSGFNAAVAGSFFAVESVLWPSQAESSSSLMSTTSTVILSAVIASVVSEIGLGSEPAFTVPDYDFRSASELPLYLLLGVFCGLVSLSLSWCTSLMMVATGKIQETLAMPKAVFPVLGGFTVGLIALIYPEVLYWGFENVDTLLESRPFVKGLPADILFQLIAVKIVATSFSRACGLVGGYYAPSLFIGAATGMAYGKFLSFVTPQLNSLFHLSGMEVASPQAYGLVGMAATLAGVCQVPLTAVLLLFELTQDYRIVFPLLGAVGLSSWITSEYTKRKHNEAKPETSSCNPSMLISNDQLASKELSICQYGCVDNTKYMTKRLLVSQAMRTRYLTVLMSTMLTEVVVLMLAEKQSCALIVSEDNLFIGVLTLGDIQEFSELSKERNRIPEELIVSELCFLNGDNKCQLAVPQTITPNMNLHYAELIMKSNGKTHLPVISEHDAGLAVGLLDKECIDIACMALATKERLLEFPQ